MATFAFAMPLLPGKEEVDREMFERFSSGDEKEAYQAARRGQGLTREVVWHQPMPNGTLAIVLMEGDDVGSALQKIATSEEPFDQRFRDFVKEVQGIDLAMDPPPPSPALGGEVDAYVSSSKSARSARSRGRPTARLFRMRSSRPRTGTRSD